MSGEIKFDESKMRLAIDHMRRGAKELRTTIHATQNLAGLIEKGAYLGSCVSESLTKTGKGELPGENNKLGSESSLSVYPNPASGIVSISFTTIVTSKTKLELYDMSGKLIKNLYAGVLDKNSQQKIELQTKDLPSGIYVVRLQTGNKIVSQNKLVVTN